MAPPLEKGLNAQQTYDYEQEILVRANNKEANENPHASPSTTPQIQSSPSVSQLLVHRSKEMI